MLAAALILLTGSSALAVELNPLSDNYFERLGVERTASNEELRAARNRLRRMYHPDALANAGASQEAIELGEKKFRFIEQAYETLANDDSRREWLAEFERTKQEQSRPGADKAASHHERPKPSSGASAKSSARPTDEAPVEPRDTRNGYADEVHTPAFQRLIDRFAHLLYDGQVEVIQRLGVASRIDPWASARLLELYMRLPDFDLRVEVFSALKNVSRHSADIREFLLARVFLNDEGRYTNLEKAAAIRALDPALNRPDTFEPLTKFMLGSKDETLRLELVRVLSHHLWIEPIRRALAMELSGSTSPLIRSAIVDVFVDNAHFPGVRSSLLAELTRAKRERSVERLLEAVEMMPEHTDVTAALFEKYEKADSPAIRQMIKRALNTPKSKVLAVRCEKLFK